MKNIVLAGFMGTGKTAVSTELARLTGYNNVDIDEEIEKTAGMSIPDIFEKFGEPHFRDLETEEIKKVCKGRNLIISLGGGAVMRDENMQAVREGGIIVCLVAEPETILQRTGNDTNRPLLQVEDPLKKINDLLNLRKPFYERADVMVQTDSKSPLEVADEILEIVKIKN
jgi:shikimate kinase